MQTFLVKPNWIRLIALQVGVLAITLIGATGLVPPASASPPPSVRNQTESPTTEPTKNQRKQAKIARKVLDSRPNNKGKVIDFRKAKKAAGKTHKNIARDVALGFLYGGRKVSHRTKADNKGLAKRARELGLPDLADEISSGISPTEDTCPGVNSIKAKWYGGRLKLDDCNVESVISGADTIAFTGGLLTTFFPLDPRAKIIMGTALAIVAAGDFALRTCNIDGTGVKIYHFLPGITAWVFCLPQ